MLDSPPKGSPQSSEMLDARRGKTSGAYAELIGIGPELVQIHSLTT